MGLAQFDLTTVFSRIPFIKASTNEEVTDLVSLIFSVLLFIIPSVLACFTVVSGLWKLLWELKLKTNDDLIAILPENYQWRDLNSTLWAAFQISLFTYTLFWFFVFLFYD